jgi:molybdopterin synthase sulfur carrier subunit
MKTKVLLFGMLAEATGQTSIIIEEAIDTNTLLQKVKAWNIDTNTADFVIAINKTIVRINQPINENDEVALLPPFAGG